ncbi:MAG: hypothetical protein HC777_02315 [Hyphomonadaceae bacterium]|nr:hypothetical protein [Hyphomonadaceae bacterium]
MIESSAAVVIPGLSPKAPVHHGYQILYQCFFKLMLGMVAPLIRETKGKLFSRAFKGQKCK